MVSPGQKSQLQSLQLLTKEKVARREGKTHCFLSGTIKNMIYFKKGTEITAEHEKKVGSSFQHNRVVPIPKPSVFLRYSLDRWIEYRVVYAPSNISLSHHLSALLCCTGSPGVPQLTICTICPIATAHVQISPG